MAFANGAAGPHNELLLDPEIGGAAHLRLPGGDNKLETFLTKGFPLVLHQDAIIAEIRALLIIIENKPVAQNDYLKFVVHYESIAGLKGARSQAVANAKQTLEGELFQLQIDLETYRKIKTSLEDVPKDERKLFRDIVNKAVPVAAAVAAAAAAAGGGGGGGGGAAAAVGAASLIPDECTDLLKAMHFIHSKIKEYTAKIATKSDELRRLK
jgi:hypothetical protein